MIAIAAITFLIGAVLMLSGDKHHAEWKKRNPNAWIYPGTKSSHLGCLLLAVSLMAFLFAVDPASWQSFRDSFHGTFH